MNASRSASSARRIRPFESLALLGAPAAAFWLINFLPIVQNRSIDAYVYTGYVHNFVDLLERYGTTYYSVRFGLILPAQLTATLFGPVAGYFVLRYILVLLAGVPFYVLIKQRYGRLPAITVLLLLLTSPFLARTVLWDYTDASGVTCLFAAICLFCIEHRRRRLLDIGAGVCAGLSIHSNVFVVAHLSIFFAAYSTVWLIRGRRLAEIARRLAVIIASLMTVTLLAATYYWWRVDRFDIFTITLQTALAMTGGGMADYRNAGVAWIARRWSALTPAVLAVLGTLVWIRRRGDFHETVVWTSAVGTTIFYFVMQFVLNGNSLELPYYFSYALPVVFLSLASLIAWLWNSTAERMRWVCAVLLLVSAIAPWILFSFEITVLVPGSFTQYVTIVTVTATLLWAADRFRRFSVSLSASVAVGALCFSSFATRPYTRTVDSRLRPNHLEMDVYQVALQFISSMPTLAEVPGRILFWYDNLRPDGPQSRRPLQSIQSTHLWGYSKVQGEEVDRGLPYLGASELERIRQPDVRWLTMLATKESQLDLGRDALRQHGVTGERAHRRALTSGDFTLYFELLDLRKRD